MTTERNNREAKSKSDTDYQPSWPQRPDRPQPDAARPRLDPPKDDRFRARSGDKPKGDKPAEEAPAGTADRQKYQRSPRQQVYMPHERSYLSVEAEDAPKRRGMWVLWVLGGLSALVIVGGLAFSLAWQGQYAGKIYAGVSVLGENMGGKTPDEAKKELNDKVQAFLAQPVVLTWRGKEWRPSADQLGLK